MYFFPRKDIVNVSHTNCLFRPKPKKKKLLNKNAVGGTYSKAEMPQLPHTQSITFVSDTRLCEGHFF